MRQADDRDAKHRSTGLSPAPRSIEPGRVFFREIQIANEGDDTIYRKRGPALEIGHAVGENRGISMKAIYHETTNQRAFFGREQVEGADQLSEDAAPLDVSDEHDRRTRVEGDAHVRNVAVVQVNLRRATRALGDDDIERLAKSIQRSGDDRPVVQDRLALPKLDRAADLSPENEL
jgi:hypothetical protein